MRAKRFSPGLVMRGISGSGHSGFGADDDGASAISAGSDGVGGLVAAIFVLLELCASEESSHLLLFSPEKKKEK